MASQDPIEIIATKILFDAASALKEMQNFNKQVDDSGKKITHLKNIISAVSKQMGGDLKSATAAVQKFANSVTGINPQLVKGIGKELQLLDNIAKKSLGAVSGQSLTANTRMSLLSNAIQQMAIKGKTSIDEVVRSLQMLNATGGKGYQFGKLGFSPDDIDKAGAMAQANASNQKFKASLASAIPTLEMVSASVAKNFGNINSHISRSTNKVQAWKDVIKTTARETGGSFESVGAKLKSLVSGTTVAPLSQALKELGDTGQSSFTKVFNSLNTLRIALGALISMLLFQGIQAVTQFGKEAVKQFTELEDSLFRIGAAEKVLSEAGAEVSVSGLKKGISDLRKELKIFSEEELTKLVGQLAVMTKELGFNEEQILALARAVAVKNKISIDDETLSQTGSKIVTTLLTDQSKGAAGLGIELGDAAIEAKALELGLLAAGESAKDLTDQEKKLAKFQIVLDSAAGDAEKWSEFLDTNSAKLAENTAAWEELQVAAGGFFASITPGFTKMLEGLTGAVNMFKALIPIWDTLVYTGVQVRDTIFSFLSPMEKLERIMNSIRGIPDTFDAIAGVEIPKLFAKIPDNAPDWFKNLFGKFLTDVETATADVEDLASIDEDDTAKTLEEIDDKLRDIAIDAQHAKEDLAVVLSQKQEDLEIKFTQKKGDIDTEYLRKEEDAARDLQRKITDIERDAERDRQKVLDKAREEERKAEEDHQLKLWELKMRYLMDLEDALHARDARQIIRLQRQYELDKQLLEKKKNQDDEERQRSTEAELEDVELKKQQRLEDAQIEYQQKLADLAASKARELEELNVWKAREQADLALWYQRELEEIDRNTQQKIEKLLAGYIEEQKIHSENQEAIHQILLKYFGKNKGLVDALVSYTAQAFAQMGALAQQAINFSANPMQVGYSPLAQNAITQHNLGEKNYAEGGSVIATRATRAVFGERGPELATFTPLDRNGRDVNKLFGGESGGGGEGRISLDILLSPDLEARIVENSMDGVANVISKINRSKV